MITNESGPNPGVLSLGTAFLRALLRNGRQVGALVPSSPALAALITEAVWLRSAPVIELGPGTGVFTRALIAKGIPQQALALVESDPGFADVLEMQFSEAHLLRLDAAELWKVSLFEGQGAGAIVSGLPFLSMPAEKLWKVLRSCFFHLREDGAMYQFTYGLRCPVPCDLLRALGLRAIWWGSTRANLPPATVYRITRAERRAD